MGSLPQSLISDFVKVAVDKAPKSALTTAYGTIVLDGNEKKVVLDGSNILMPLASTVLTNVGDRVRVAIQNHTAIVDGNVSSPAVNKDGVIASINLSGETATISASKIDLKGVATFSNGGGVNFLRNTGHVQTWRQTRSSTSEFIDDRTVKIYKMGTDDDWDSAVHTWPRFDTAELFGKTVTLSFWAKVSARYQYIDSNFAITFNTSGSSDKTGARTKYKYVDFYIPTSTAIGTWQKFTYTIENVSEDFFSLGSGNVGGYFYLAIYNRSPNTLQFKDFKIEEGHVATTWSPSPLDDNYSVYDEQLGITVIDGGKIKTGSITAEQINVKNLFAQDIAATGDITFKNSKYEISADADTGAIVIQTTRKTDVNVPLKIKSWNDLNLEAGGSMTMLTSVGYAKIGAANDILFESGSGPNHVQIQDGTKNYPIGAYTYRAGTSAGSWSYKRWADGTVDLWCYINIDTVYGVTFPNNFGDTGMKMSDPIAVPDYPLTLSYVRNVQMNFSTIVEGRGALVWPSGKRSITNPGSFRLIRPDTSKAFGYVYISARGVI